MSTSRDGETTRIVDSFLTLKDRLHYLSENVQSSSHDVSRVRHLRQSAGFLELWEQEHINVNRRAFRDGLVMNDAKASRIRKKLEEAEELIQHCEYTLKISYPHASNLEPRLTEYVASVLA
jgi:hypothetical protein